MPLGTTPSPSSSTLVNELPPDSVIYGNSAAMEVVREKIEKVAGIDIPVLVQGESGTGKEIVAKCIHRGGKWKEGPFVKLNCPAIPSTLLESELFGYEKGAFTGAYGSKPGRIELAHRGTLFLDEISELEGVLQAKLLQFLQDGQFCRIGGSEDRRVETQVICATNCQLAQALEEGSFRRDLYYRIDVIGIRLPPLRERIDDVPQLVSYFLECYNERMNCQAPPLSPPVMQALRKHRWPGNIRELENLVKRYIVLGSEEEILNELLSLHEGEGATPDILVDGRVPLKKLTRQVARELERKILLKTLQYYRWNRKKTASALEISYRALLYKMKEAGLPQKNAQMIQGTGALAQGD